MSSTMTVQELAQQLSNAIETAKRADGAEFIRLKDGSPAWMTEVIRSVHGDSLPDDTTYRFIEKCAEALAEAEDYPQDAINEIEPDVYTADLTAWLAARNSHVDYLTEAMEQFQPKDGFNLLQIAQQLHIQEVGYALVTALENIDLAA